MIHETLSVNRFLQLSSVPLFLLAIIAFFEVVAKVKINETPEGLERGPPSRRPSMNLGTFVVNMPDGKYYLKTTMSLAFTDSGPMEWMTARTPLVKDMIIRHLQSISVELLEDLRYRQSLNNDLMIRLNSLFPNEPTWGDLAPLILFTEFYKQ